MKKILINTFALIGFVTFILLACSVDEIADSSNNNNNSASNNYGKYQIALSHIGSTRTMAVLNTETGVLKTFYTDGNDWYNFDQTLAGLDGNVTFTH